MNKRKQLIVEMPQLAEICGVSVDYIYQAHHRGEFSLEDLASVIKFCYPLIHMRDQRELLEYRKLKEEWANKRKREEEEIGMPF